MSKDIIVVGAGFAGLAAARKLGKKYKKDKDVNITLIDRHSYLTYMTELHEVAGGRVEPDAIKYDLKKLFGRLKNVKLVTDNVKTINYETQEVIAEHGSYHYDYIVLAMGGEANDFGVKGVKEHGFTLWSMEAAERVREHIIDAVYRAAREHDEAKRRALLSFVVCGAGFTGVEMVGELFEWLPILAKEHKLNPDEISYHLIEAAPSILNTMTEKEQTRAIHFMEKKGVQISLGDGIVEVKEDGVVLASGKEIPSYTTIWTAGVQANQELVDWNLERARAGRLVVDEFMKAKDKENVYVAGDLVYFEDPSHDGQLMPQIVQAAEQTGDIAAKSIISEISGTEKEAFRGKYDGNMVSIGSKYSVSRLYDKYSVHGLISTFVKHAANVKYFISIGSFYYAWMYIVHEILNMKNRRTMLRGHSSTQGNVAWALPMRLFYGAMWFVEGLKKCFGMFGGESWFGEDLKMPFDWVKVADTATAASGAATEAVDATTAASGATGAAAETTTEAVKSVFSLNYVYGEEPKLVFDHMPEWFKSIMKIFVPNHDVAMFMQKFMSVVELLIGVALILGIFTWLVSAVTIPLVVVFCLSGMFVWVNMWFVPAALAIMNGAGHCLGVDHYLMPWLKDKLGDWWFGKSRHIYNEAGQ